MNFMPLSVFYHIFNVQLNDVLNHEIWPTYVEPLKHFSEILLLTPSHQKSLGTHTRVKSKSTTIVGCQWFLAHWNESNMAYLMKYWGLNKMKCERHLAQYLITNSHVICYISFLISFFYYSAKHIKCHLLCKNM